MTARPSRRPPRSRPDDGVPLVPWGAGRVAVLGIDQATRNLGFVALGWGGELLDWTALRLPSKVLPLDERLAIIRTVTQAAIRELRPAAIAFERGTGHHPSPETDVLTSLMRPWCDAMGTPSVGYTPSQWRMTVCGDGRLGKEAAWDTMQIKYPAFRTLYLGTPRGASGDVLDAFGIGMCWIERNRSPLARALSEPGAAPRMIAYRRTVRRRSA